MTILPITNSLIPIYTTVGEASYCEHYLHLWKDGNAAQYLDSNFTPEVVRSELEDDNVRHFLVRQGQEFAGIMKIVDDAAVDHYSASEAMLLEKIYLLAAHSGQGLGYQCIGFVLDLARSMGKEILWLDTMKKGRALAFYLKTGFEIFGKTQLPFSNTIVEERPMYRLLYRLS